jgi:hypothetical protein
MRHSERQRHRREESAVAFAVALVFAFSRNPEIHN